MCIDTHNLCTYIYTYIYIYIYICGMQFALHYIHWIGQLRCVALQIAFGLLLFSLQNRKTKTNAKHIPRKPSNVLKINKAKTTCKN